MKIRLEVNQGRGLADALTSLVISGKKTNHSFDGSTHFAGKSRGGNGLGDSQTWNGLKRGKIKNKA